MNNNRRAIPKERTPKSYEVNHLMPKKNKNYIGENRTKVNDTMKKDSVKKTSTKNRK